MNKKNTCPDRALLLDSINKCPNIHEVAKVYNTSWQTIRVWMRWLSIDLKPSKVDLIFDCQTLTDKEICKKRKVSERTLTKWKKEYGISKKSMRLDNFPAELTQLQKDCMIGKLLGDGYLEKIRSDKANTCFGVEHCLEQEEYLIYCQEIMNPFSCPVRYRSRKNPFKSKDTHADQINSCLFKTSNHPIFTKLRNQWYPDGIKRVPEDLDLNWTSVAFWYCDDGSNLLGKRCCRRHGILCTNSFQVEEVQLLVQKLRKLNVSCDVIFDKKNQPMIEIHKNTFMYFLNNVKKHISCNCMKYKLKTNIESDMKEEYKYERRIQI